MATYKIAEDLYIGNTGVLLKQVSTNKNDIATNKTNINKNGICWADNPSTTITITGTHDVCTQDIIIGSGSGKILIIGTLYIKVDSGTPMIHFLVDGTEVKSFYDSESGVSTFHCVKTGLSKGKHTVKMRVTKGNSISYLMAYTARNLTVIEI